MSLWYDVTHTHTHSGDLVLFSANVKWSAHALHILPLNWPLRLCVCGCVRDAERCRGIKYNYRDVCIWVAPPSLSLQNLHTYLICFLTAPFSPLFLHLPLWPLNTAEGANESGLPIQCTLWPIVCTHKHTLHGTARFGVEQKNEKTNERKKW